MNYARSMSRYAIKSFHKDECSERRARTIAYLNEAIKRQCPDYDYRAFPFRQYLTDNPDLIPYLIQIFDEPGSRTLFVSQCGSGKSHMVCVALPKALKPIGKAVILLTPNVIQCDQDGKYYYEDEKTGERIYVIPINASNKNDIKIEPGLVYAVVYDSAKSRFEALPREQLKNVLLVIDEAHEFESALDYRGPAINALNEIIKYVRDYGGNIMYMTGTPRRIMGYAYEHMIEGYKVDENGEPVNEINVGRIDLYQNCSKSNMTTLTVKTMLDINGDGGSSLVRLNDKTKIRQVEETLKETNLNGAVITADNKGYTVEEYEDEYGIPQYCRVFASKGYRTLTEEDALPSLDYHVATSVLDVGTSIKGIKTEDGSIRQDPDLVPVYICSHPTDFDLDNITQFYARLRYPLHRAVIVMNRQEDKYPDIEPSLEDCIIDIAQDAYDALEAERSDNAKALKMPTLDGRTPESLLTTLPDGTRDICVAAIYSRGCVRYYNQIAHKPDKIAEILENEFGIPCENHYVTEMIDLQLAAPEAVDPRIRELAQKALTEDADFYRDLVADKFNVYASQIRPLNGAKKVLQNMKNLYISERFKTEQIADIAINMVENRRAVAVDKDGIIVNPRTEPVDDFIRRLAKVPVGVNAEGQIAKFVRAYGKSGDAKGNIGMVTAIRNDQLRAQLCYFAQTRLGYNKLDWLVRIWDDANGLISWKRACEIVATTKESELYHAYRIICVVGLNAYDYLTDARQYTLAVQQHRLESGAEYHALRYYKDGLWYVDEEYADETDPAVRKAHTSLHYKGGLDGKTFSDYDLEQIGLQFPDIMRKMGIKCNRTRPYTRRQIEKGIKAEFRCYPVKDAAGNIVDGKFRTKGLRQSIRNAFGEKPLSKAEVLAGYNAILTNDRLPYEDKISELSHMVGQLTELGYAEEQAIKARDAVVNSIAFDEECPFVDSKSEFPYQKGALMVILDAEKAHPEKEVLSVEDATRILALGADDQLGARIQDAHQVLENMKTERAICDADWDLFNSLYPGYTERFDRRAVPPHLMYVDEIDLPMQRLLYEVAAYAHKFYWDGEWYQNPDEARCKGDDVDPRVSVFWRTDARAYRGWIHYITSR